MLDEEYTSSIDNLRILTVVKNRVKRLNSGVSVNGKESKVVEDYKVTEYIDVQTGEILTGKQAKSLGVTEIDFSLMVLQREHILNGLRPEVRDFAVFVLKFRNNRRGITPDIHKLCKMYSQLTSKRLDNIKRLIPVLKASKILASETLMMPLFQKYNKNMKAKDHLSEDFNAEVIFDKIQRDYRNKL